MNNYLYLKLSSFNIPFKKNQVSFAYLKNLGGLTRRSDLVYLFSVC